MAVLQDAGKDAGEVAADKISAELTAFMQWAQQVLGRGIVVSVFGTPAITIKLGG